MKGARGACFASAALLVAGVLTGCSSTSARCIDFVSLPAPEDRFRAATLVVEAQLTRTDATVDDFAIYPAYRAEVLKTFKGRAPDQRLTVIATSDQCEQQGRPAEYVDGDPLAGAGRRIVYLVPSDAAKGVWKLVTPDAVDEPSAAPALPSP